MAIVGFAFNKILCERKEGTIGNIKINNNVAITKVEQQDLSLGSEKQIGVKFKFEFSSKYDPNVGEILLHGEVLYMDEEKKIKEIVSSWKKDKKVPQDVMTLVLNNVLTKCNIEALIFSKEINLPPPLQLPKVEAKETTTKKK